MPSSDLRSAPSFDAPVPTANIANSMRPPAPAQPRVDGDADRPPGEHPREPDGPKRPAAERCHRIDGQGGHHARDHHLAVRRPRRRGHQAGDPQHGAGRGRDGDVVVERDRHRLGQPRGDGCEGRGEDDEHQSRRLGATVGASPPRQGNARGTARDDEGAAAPPSSSPDSTAARGGPSRCPTSVAAPSPNAMMPHALPAMSRRFGNATMSSSTASG